MYYARYPGCFASWFLFFWQQFGAILAKRSPKKRRGQDIICLSPYEELAMIDTDLVFEFAGRQLRSLIETHPDAFPMYTEGGQWKIGGESWTNWARFLIWLAVASF